MYLASEWPYPEINCMYMLLGLDMDYSSQPHVLSTQPPAHETSLKK